MIVDWGERTNAYPRAWIPAVPGVWDWGPCTLALASGLATLTFSSAAPGIAFTSAAPGIAFSAAAPAITFTED